jgi:hypothetical protein
LVIALTLSAAPALANSHLVDDFDDPVAPGVSVLTGEGDNSFVQFTDAVAGGVREVYHRAYLNPLGSVSAVAAGGGLLSSSDGVGVTSEVLVSYGSFTNPSSTPGTAGPFLGLDVTPFDAFQLDFGGIAQRMNINIVMYSSTPLDAASASPTYYTASAVNVVPDVPGGPLSVVLSFADGAGGFNFNRVDGIVLVLNRAVGDVTNNAFNVDRFSLVSSVPESPTSALLLAGLGAGMLLSRRRGPV